MAPAVSLMSAGVSPPTRRVSSSCTFITPASEAACTLMIRAWSSMRSPTWLAAPRSVRRSAFPRLRRRPAASSQERKAVERDHLGFRARSPTCAQRIVARVTLMDLHHERSVHVAGLGGGVT